MAIGGAEEDGPRALSTRASVDPEAADGRGGGRGAIVIEWVLQMRAVSSHFAHDVIGRAHRVAWRGPVLELAGDDGGGGRRRRARTQGEGQQAAAGMDNPSAFLITARFCSSRQRIPIGGRSTLLGPPPASRPIRRRRAHPRFGARTQSLLSAPPPMRRRSPWEPAYAVCFTFACSSGYRD
jgi:hypothetical protein